MLLVTLRRIDVILLCLYGAVILTRIACIMAAMRATSTDPERFVHAMQKPRRSQQLPEIRDGSCGPSECQMRWIRVRDNPSCSLSWAHHAQGQSARQQYLFNLYASMQKLPYQSINIMQKKVTWGCDTSRTLAICSV